MASPRLVPGRLAIVNKRLQRIPGFRESFPRETGYTPKLFKGLLFLFIAIFGLIGIRLLPSVSSEDWWPTLSLHFALVLIAAALVKVLRTR